MKLGTRSAANGSARPSRWISTSPKRLGVAPRGRDGQDHEVIIPTARSTVLLERFVGIFIETTGGEFPVWVAPTGVVVPVNPKAMEYAEQTAEMPMPPAWRRGGRAREARRQDP